MSVWAIADLHLSFGVANKSMDIFGSKWNHHPEKIRSNWMELIHSDDLVLIPGDVSWAMNPEEAKIDLNWISELPGTKVLLRGNHDYWWSSLAKIQSILPNSIHVIQNNIFMWKNIAIGGARLWDTSEYSFHPYIEYCANPRVKALNQVDNQNEAEKIFQRELHRLETSLKCFPNDPTIYRVAMTHYPPISSNLQASSASALLEKYKVSSCVFGHLHNVKTAALPFGTRNGVQYFLTSCDYLDFRPIKIKD